MQGQTAVTDWDVIYPEKEYIFGDFTQRLWAYLTIQQLLEIRLEPSFDLGVQSQHGC